MKRNNKNSKELLFEMMGKVNPSFKMMLNENYDEPTNNIGEPFRNLKYNEYTKTIRSVPENYWIASVGDDGEIKFDSWDGAVRGRIDKDYVINWYNDNVKNVNENIYSDDSPTNRALRDFVKASDPEGYKRKWDRERPNEVEPEPIKHDVKNRFKDQSKNGEIKETTVTEERDLRHQKIQKIVDGINRLIELAVDSDGDPIGVVDNSSTWPEPEIYEPIRYDKMGRLIITSHSPYNPKKINKDIINSRDMELDGIPTLKLIMRLYKKALKDNNIQINEISTSLANQSANSAGANLSKQDVNPIDVRKNVDRIKKFKEYINPVLKQYADRFGFVIERDEFGKFMIFNVNTDTMVEIRNGKVMDSRNVNKLPDNLVTPLKKLVDMIIADSNKHNDIDSYPVD